MQEGKLLTCLSWQILPAWSGTLWVEGNLCPSWEQPEWSSWSAETDEGSSKSVTKIETGKLLENEWKDFQEPNTTYSCGVCYSLERFWKPLGWGQHFKKEEQRNLTANPLISNLFDPKDLRPEASFCNFTFKVTSFLCFHKHICDEGEHAWCLWCALSPPQSSDSVQAALYPCNI